LAISAERAEGEQRGAYGSGITEVCSLEDVYLVSASYLQASHNHFERQM